MPSLSGSDLVEALDQLDEVLKIVRGLVAPTSFAIGIMQRARAKVLEMFGRMDECVVAYKELIPTAEKHLDKYDQNIFDGLSRIIDFHLERNEVAESLPYVQEAWERLQLIPGRNSLDFRVVDRLRKDIQATPAFSFAKFCFTD